MNWHLQDAKNHFSKLVRKAQTDGPQTVTVRGKPAVVVLSSREYEDLSGNKTSLAEFLLSGPIWDDELIEDINRRPKHPPREIDL